MDDWVNVRVVNTFRVEDPVNVQWGVENNGSFQGMQPPPWWPGWLPWPL